MARRFSRRRFASAVTRSDIPMPKLKSRRKCAGCSIILTTDEPVVRLRLKKVFQQPCLSCSHKPTKLKFFHVACCPSDVNLAMGFDPNLANATPPPASRVGAPVAPPPKPPTFEDAALASLVALEHALRIRASKMTITPEVEAKFKTFQGIKARVLRPGTPAEGEVATHLALKRLIDLVFA